MFRHIHSTGIVVDDLDAALAFYVGLLGFEKRIDNLVGDDMRFVTVAPKGAQTEIALNPRSMYGDRALIPNGISFIVDDVDAVCDVLKANNVEIVHGPVDEPWGPRGAAFKDPFGNEFFITTLWSQPQ